MKAQSRSTAGLANAAQRANQSVDDLVDHGAALIEEGAYTEAIAVLAQALAIDAEQARAYALRGQAYWQRNELDQALADLDQALALDPNDANAYGTHQRRTAALAQYPEALADYSEALQLDPDNTWIAPIGATPSMPAMSTMRH